MRSALACLALIVVAVAGTPAVAQKASDKDKTEGELISVRGCVSGSLLKTMTADPGTGVGSFETGDRYRMIGSKATKAQIKAANKGWVEVTGRVKPGPQSVVKGTKVGGTSIGIGVAPGPGSLDQPQAPYTPTIEVEEIVVLAKTC
jgi:hypothetical protein